MNRLREINAKYRQAVRASNVVYHYTDFEGAIGILRSGVIKPTTNFENSFKARGMKPGVSLSRRSDMRRYGTVRFAFDLDVVKHNHKVRPFEFGEATRNEMPQYTNAEEHIEGPMRIGAALLGIDVLRGIAYRKNNGEAAVEQIRELTKVPVRVHDGRTLPPLHRTAMAKETIRQEAVDFIVGRLRSGWSWDSAVAGDYMPKRDSPLGHITKYLEDLYESNNIRPWIRFENECKRIAKKP